MKLDRTVAALADPARHTLLRRLARDPCRAGDLAKGFAIRRPATCKHTRMLAGAGLIRATKVGRERIYRLAPNGGRAVKELIVELEEVGGFRDAALESFKRYVEEKG